MTNDNSKKGNILVTYRFSNDTETITDIDTELVFII